MFIAAGCHPAVCWTTRLMSNRLFPFALFLLAVMVLGRLSHAADNKTKPVDFVHEVQPIFKQSCYSCHGPEKSKAGLRLDAKARAMKGGENGAVIVPGNSAKSPLFARLISTDAEERMPQKAE